MGLVRLFLALTVVISHSGIVNSYVGGGGLAVLFFFIISGFCMALVLNGKYSELLPFRFYAARYLRLWPPFIVVVLLVFVFVKPVPDFLRYPLAIIPTFFLVGHDVLWWVSPTGSPVSSILAPNFASLTGMQQMWSVGIEISFYAIAPFFARRLSVTLLLLVIAFLVHVLLTLKLPPMDPQLVHGALNHLWLFVLGVAMYWAWRRIKPLLDRVQANPTIVSIGAVILTAILAHLRTTSVFPLASFRNDYSLVIFALIVVPLFHFTRSAKADRVIGEMSYPLYVAHFPIVAYLITNHRGDPVWTAILCTVSLVAALALHTVVIRPVDRWRARLARAKASGTNGTISAVQSVAP